MKQKLIKDRCIVIEKNIETFSKDALGCSLYNGFYVSDGNKTTFQLSETWFIHIKNCWMDTTCPVMITKSKEFPKKWNPNFIPIAIGLGSFRYFAKCRDVAYLTGWDCLLMANESGYSPEHNGTYIAFGSFSAVNPLISTCLSAAVSNANSYFNIKKIANESIKTLI